MGNLPYLLEDEGLIVCNRREDFLLLSERVVGTGMTAAVVGILLLERTRLYSTEEARIWLQIIRFYRGIVVVVVVVIVGIAIAIAIPHKI